MIVALQSHLIEPRVRDMAGEANRGKAMPHDSMPLIGRIFELGPNDVSRTARLDVPRAYASL